MQLSDLAEKWGKSIQNLSGLLKRDNFRERELEEIAEALDCELIINFKNNTNEIY